MASSSKTTRAQSPKAVKATVTSAREWKSKKATGSVDLELPSGNVCRVRIMTVPEMIADGLLVDSLLPVVQGHIDKGSGKRPQDHKGSKKKASETDESMALLKDPKKMAEMFDGMDRAVAKVVVEPKVLYHKRSMVADVADAAVEWETIPEDERDGDQLYTDEVDIADKMYIFNFVIGGDTNLDSFRAESGQALAGLGSVAVSDVSTE